MLTQATSAVLRSREQSLLPVIRSRVNGRSASRPNVISVSGAAKARAALLPARRVVSGRRARGSVRARGGRQRQHQPEQHRPHRHAVGTGACPLACSRRGAMAGSPRGRRMVTLGAATLNRHRATAGDTGVRWASPGRRAIPGSLVDGRARISLTDGRALISLTRQRTCASFANAWLRHLTVLLVDDRAGTQRY